MAIEIVKLTDGNGKFLTAVYQSEAGFVVVFADYPLNKIVAQRYVAEQIAEVAASRIVRGLPHLAHGR